MKKIFIILSLFLGFGFTGVVLSAQAASFEDLPLTAESCFEFEVYDPILQTCVIECDTEAECAELEAVLDELLGAIDDSGNDFEESERMEDTLIISYMAEGELLTEPLTFSIEPEYLSYQVNEDLHQDTWDHFLTIAPMSFVKGHISTFELFSDGQDGNLAYVTQDPDNAEMWIVGIDIVDAVLDSEELNYTLIHEFAHLLSLESNQVPPSIPVFEAEFNEELTEAEFWVIFNEQSANCDRFFTGEGCANEDSYINKFFFRFWTDIYAERLTFDPGDIEKEAEFYAKYQDRFVSEYAVTSPGEDFAESFTHFVLSDRTGAITIAEQKINFFYDFPELVDLRQFIRASLITDDLVTIPPKEPVEQPTKTPLETEEPEEEEEEVKPPVSQSFEDIVRGRILLQVESNGEAWYVDPVSLKRYFLGRPADAFKVMRGLALGVTNKDLLKIKQFGTSGENAGIDKAFAQSMAGKILLQVEGHGEAWYVHPQTLDRYFLGRPADAFKLMRNLGLGITTFHLEALVEGSVE